MPLIDSSLFVLLFWAVAAYLIGSVPFGMVLTRAMNLGDLRSIGSGNIGATNVLRTGSKKAAALTLILDGGKGAVAVLLARLFAGEDAAQIAALAAVWLGFKGGKGVATFLGVLLALAWPVGLACCLAWLIAMAVTRTSSIGGLASAAASTFFMIFLGYGSALFLGILLTLLVFWRHRENIKRIRAGTEPKIGAKKD